jgi:selenocysteine-specific elongation factor
MTPVGERPLPVVVGTAGHIDHGKTALVRALTGIDCDRLPEEKRRGITIDLGFAHADWDGLRLSFVDVPGHERFIRNMLAGATGVDVALLVVASDESIRPQTVEHLDICRLLGIPAGVVALTKCDRVDADTIELARDEVEALVRGTFLEGAPIVPTSATTGSGLDELRAELVRIGRETAGRFRAEREALPARLPIDRAFVVHGYGPVVTGTLVAGRIAEGDRLELHPGGREARVRGLQVHGEAASSAGAGERVSLNLAGVEIGELVRGGTVAAPGSLRAARWITVDLLALGSLSKGIRDGARIRFHVGAAEVLGRLRLPGGSPLEPGEGRLAQIVLDEAVAVRGGDRFVLRGATPVATIGGGRIADPALPRISGRAPWRDEAEAVLRTGSPEAKLRLWVRLAGERGLAIERLDVRLGAAPAAIEGIVARSCGGGEVERHGDFLFLAETRLELEARARRFLEEAGKDDPTRLHVPRSELVQRVLGRVPAAGGGALLALWSSKGVFRIDRERVLIPGRSQGLGGEESKGAAAIRELYEKAGLMDAPSPAAAASTLGLKPQIAEGLVRHLIDRKVLVRLPGEWIVSRKAVDALVERLRGSGRREIDIAGFKELFGLTRKLAIPMLEWLDSNRVTLRDGDRRKILPPPEK